MAEGETVTKHRGPVRAFEYKTRDNAAISVCLIDAPYGPESESVVSVGCTLKGDYENPTWVVHVPLHLASDVGHAIMQAARPQTKTSWTS